MDETFAFEFYVLCKIGRKKIPGIGSECGCNGFSSILIRCLENNVQQSNFLLQSFSKGSNFQFPLEGPKVTGTRQEVL